MYRPKHRISFTLAFVLALFGFAGIPVYLVSAQSAPVGQEGSYGKRFDTAWTLVSERYWDTSYGGADWGALKRTYRPEAVAAGSDRVFYGVLERLYDELGDNHSVFVPPAKVQRVRQQYGDLPCLGVFGLTEPLSGQSERFGPVSYRLEATEGYLVGVVTLPNLATTGVAGDLRRAVRRLGDQGARAFVLDLRGNPGGRLVEMMSAAGVFTKGFLWRTLTRWALPLPYPALGSAETDAPLAVLIDKNVNSAAEGLAGVLQSTGRAQVFGDTSAGNVEAVLPFCLRDGSQAWIATGVLAPLRGPTWEGRGVVPDRPSSRPLEDALSYLRGL